MERKHFAIQSHKSVRCGTKVRMIFMSLLLPWFKTNKSVTAQLPTITLLPSLACLVTIPSLDQQLMPLGKNHWRFWLVCRAPKGPPTYLFTPFSFGHYIQTFALYHKLKLIFWRKNELFKIIYSDLGAYLPILAKWICLLQECHW